MKVTIEKQHKDFYDVVHCYFKSSLEFIQRKFPLDDSLICKAVWLNVLDRLQGRWEQVQFFFDLYPKLMVGISTDDLYEEFTDYQILRDDEIGDGAWDDAKVSDGLKSSPDDEDTSYPL